MLREETDVEVRLHRGRLILHATADFAGGLTMHRPLRHCNRIRIGRWVLEIGSVGFARLLTVNRAIGIAQVSIPNSDTSIIALSSDISPARWLDDFSGSCGIDSHRSAPRARADPASATTKQRLSPRSTTSLTIAPRRGERVGPGDHSRAIRRRAPRRLIEPPRDLKPPIVASCHGIVWDGGTPAPRATSRRRELRSARRRGRRTSVSGMFRTVGAVRFEFADTRSTSSGTTRHEGAGPRRGPHETLGAAGPRQSTGP
jgi:hypothetical protein